MTDVLRRWDTRSVKLVLREFHTCSLLVQKKRKRAKVSVRSRYLGDEGIKDLGDFMSAIKEEIKNKTIRKIEVQEEKK